MKKLNIILSVLSMILLGVGSAILGTSSFLSSPTKEGEVNMVSTIPSTEPEIEEEITYTFKTYEDYFTDFEISKDKITEADLTGTGSEADPYIVHSTKGFLYLTNKDLSGIIINYKYIVLNCEIILNDEIFDEKGNPSGGDGVVYQWTPLKQGNIVRANINGRNNHIKGLYINLPTSNYVSLFGNNSLNMISNLRVENFYLCGSQNTSVMSFSSINLINSHLYNGNIYGKGNCSGFSTIIRLAENCSNYANINGTTEAGGIISYVENNNVISNCKNYGKISVTTGSSGGIAGRVYQGRIINCKNYGEIQGKANHLGGIAGIFVSNGKVGLLIEGCKNYGKINAPSASNLGGIMGICDGIFSILNCENYGRIETTSIGKGEIIGRIFSGYDSFITRGIIKRCNIESIGNLPIVGEIGSSKYGIEVEMANVKAKYKNALSSWQNLIAGKVSSGEINFEANNIEINLEGENHLVRLFNEVNKTSNVKLKNILVKTQLKGSLNTFGNILIGSTANMDILNLIVQSSNVKVFYGSDFSNYYISWRTGKIGLIELDGRGFFQGKVDEEWLLESGYQKKVG